MSGLVKFVILLVILFFIIVTVLLSLYFTCTWPFGSSDSCLCTDTDGTYEDDVCTCPVDTLLKSKKCIACKDNEEVKNGVCVCKSGFVKIDGICVVCPSGEVVVNGVCECPSSTLKDPSDGKCKSASVYNTKKYGKVLCPIGFSTNPVRNDIFQTCGEDEYCNMCLTTKRPDTWPLLKYIKNGKTFDWPDRPQNLVNTEKPSCTEATTFVGTSITEYPIYTKDELYSINAMPVDC